MIIRKIISIIRVSIIIPFVVIKKNDNQIYKNLILPCEYYVR